MAKHFSKLSRPDREKEFSVQEGCDYPIIHPNKPLLTATQAEIDDGSFNCRVFGFASIALVGGKVRCLNEACQFFPFIS